MNGADHTNTSSECLLCGRLPSLQIDPDVRWLWPPHENTKRQSSVWLTSQKKLWGTTTKFGKLLCSAAVGGLQRMQHNRTIRKTATEATVYWIEVLILQQTSNGRFINPWLSTTWALSSRDYSPSVGESLKNALMSEKYSLNSRMSGRLQNHYMRKKH